jgi:probable F420-dependent oxidoreductase
MDFGIFTFSTDRDMSPGEFAVEVEDRGFDRLLFTEHSHIPAARDTPYPDVYGGGLLPDFYKRTYDPFVACSYAAAATTRLRVGTGVCLLALRDPIHTAKEIASIDRLSGGRFDFGVGFGWNADEFDSHGAAFGHRHEVVAERVALMRNLWSQEIASFEGAHHTLAPSWAWPKPARPDVPVLLGGNGPRSMRHAARWADAWYPTGVADDPTLSEAIPRLKQLVADAGREPSAVRVGVAPGVLTDERMVEAWARNGVDFVTALVVANDPAGVLRELDRFARMRDDVLGATPV